MPLRVAAIATITRLELGADAEGGRGARAGNIVGGRRIRRVDVDDDRVVAAGGDCDDEGVGAGGLDVLGGRLRAHALDYLAVVRGDTAADGRGGRFAFLAGHLLQQLLHLSRTHLTHHLQQRCARHLRQLGIRRHGCLQDAAQHAEKCHQQTDNTLSHVLVLSSPHLPTWIHQHSHHNLVLLLLNSFEPRLEHLLYTYHLNI